MMNRETERDLAAMVKVEKRAKETARAEAADLRRQLAEIRSALGAPDDMPNNEVTEVARGMAELLMECLGDNMPVVGEGE